MSLNAVTGISVGFYFKHRRLAPFHTSGAERRWTDGQRPTSEHHPWVGRACMQQGTRHLPSQGAALKYRKTLHEENRRQTADPSPPWCFGVWKSAAPALCSGDDRDVLSGQLKPWPVNLGNLSPFHPFGYKRHTSGSLTCKNKFWFTFSEANLVRLGSSALHHYPACGTIKQNRQQRLEVVPQRHRRVFGRQTNLLSDSSASSQGSAEDAKPQSDGPAG